MLMNAQLVNYYEPHSLRVQWANQTDIPFSKYAVVNLYIGKGKDNCNLDSPFLITTEQISNPIPRFNAIKHVAQTTDDTLLLIKLFQISFDQTDWNRIQAFANPLQTPDSVEATLRLRLKERTQLFQQVVMLKYPAKLILKTFHKHNQ